MKPTKLPPVRKAPAMQPQMPPQGNSPMAGMEMPPGGPQGAPGGGGQIPPQIAALVQKMAEAGMQPQEIMMKLKQLLGGAGGQGPAMPSGPGMGPSGPPAPGPQDSHMMDQLAAMRR